MTGAFLAVDWGTTNRRAFLLEDDGRVRKVRRDDRGATKVAPGGFPGEIVDLRRELGDLPVLCAGMVGSERGWTQVPYARCPAGVEELIAGVVWMDERTAIVPGLSFHGDDRTDVMRGEEVQLVGAVEAGTVPPTALLCQPGTHCKWAWIEQRRIDRFATAITGELFALLREHSLLSAQLADPPRVGPSFRAGIAASEQGDPTDHLFGVRADAVTGRDLIEDPSSFVSGLLIGTDVRRRVRKGEQVHVLADPVLGPFYVEAVRELGGDPTLIDADAAFVDGMNRIRAGLR